MVRLYNPNLILVVDDERSLRMQMRSLLENDGYQVVEAASGEQALDVYTEVQPAMVLLDIMMREMDGISFCQQLQNLPGGDNIPILIITSTDEPASIEKAFATGAMDYISKPVQWIVLQHRIRLLLATRRGVE